MAITTITVTGKVVGADGIGVNGGTIEITLQSPATVPDGAVEQQVGGTFKTTISSTGDVNFVIIPSANLTPATNYNAKFVMHDGTIFTKVWTVPGTDQDIGDL